MKIILKTLLLISSMIIAHVAFCQPVNDSCSNATSLGTLPAPAPCTGLTIQQGATVTLTGQTTVGATPSNPYAYNGSCPVNVSSLPHDVWYSFVASSYQAVLSVSAAAFANPMITVWQGSCGSFSTIGCVTGTSNAANLTVYQLTIGQTYYIQIAGIDSTQNGTFTLAAHNDDACNECFVAGNIIATPPPVNGTYAAGQTVNFCFTVTNWSQISSNWFHGMVPSFGIGWDTTTLSTISVSAPCTVGGIWAWYPNGEISSATGTQWPAGFYYETSAGNANSVIDNDPGNNYGDDDPSNFCAWQFCMSITARSNITNGTDLSAVFHTSADGESGSWTSVACANDPPAFFHAISACGTGHTAISQTICSGDSFLFNGHYRKLAGTYIDTAIVIAGCDTVISTLTLAVNNSCNSGGPDQTICQNSTVMMAAAGSGTWTALASNPAVAVIANPTSDSTGISGFTASGSYRFIWVADTVTVTVNPNPVANYNLPSLSDTLFICLPAIINPFTDASTNAVSYSWNFGDGSASDTSQNPSHIWTIPNNYPVTEIVTSAQGCVDSITKYTIHISGPSVTMTASVIPSCTCTSVTYYLSSVGVDSIQFTSPGMSGFPLFSNMSVSPVGTSGHPTLDSLTVVYCRSGVVRPHIVTLNSTGGCSVIYDSLIAPIVVTGTPTVSITVTPDSIITAGQTATLTASCTPSGGTYTWAPLININPLSGDSATVSVNPSINASYCVTYTVNGCSTSGCQGIQVLPVSMVVDSVWPGDADNSRIVDNNDLLPIGLGYDSTGAIRSVQGIVWQADASTNWVDSFTSYSPAVNFNHADCNGDGIINADDTLAITQNFGLVHAKTYGSEPWRSGIPALLAIPSRDTLHAGDTLIVTFVLGDSMVSVVNFYALAFTYNFDPMIADSAYTSMSYGSSWIGTPTEKISINKIFNNTGEIKTAVTRIDHTNRSGSGAIATARFIINTQNVTGQDRYYTNIGSISNVTAINALGHVIALNAGADTSRIVVTPNGISEISTETLHIQPNPAHDKVLVMADNIIRKLSITDVMGQEVMNNNTIASRSTTIDISAFSGGIYFIEVRTDRGVAVAKLVVEK